MFFSLLAKAQDPLYRSLDVSNGLPSNEVYDLLQDKKGYMWIGSAKGITRYSGYQSKTFTHKAMTGYSLSNLCEDSQGTIWCSNFSGQIFYVKDDSMYLFKRFDPDKTFSNSYIYVYEDKLYAVEKYALVVYDILKDTYTRYPYTKNGQTACFRNFTAHKDTIYGNTSVGVLTFYQQHFQNNYPIEIEEQHARENIPPSSWLVRFQGKLYEYSKSSPTLFEIRKGKRINVFLEKKSVVLAVSQDKGHLYVNTAEGYYKLKKDRFSKPIFTDFSISDQLEDREGNLWVSTLFNGILIVPNTTVRQQELKSINTITQMCALPDKRQLALGTKRGEVAVLNDSNWDLLRKSQLPVVKDIEMLYYDLRESKLITSNGGMYREGRKGWKSLRTNIGPKSLLRYRMSYFFVNQGGAYFMAVDSSLITRKYKGAQFESFFGFPDTLIKRYYNSYSVIENQRFYGVCYDSVQDRLYATGKDNLFSYEKGKIRVLNYKGKAIRGRSIHSHHGRVYIAGINQGLYIIDKDGSIACINKSNVFKSIYAFTCTGNFLFGLCDSGVLKYNLQTGRYSVLSASDGFSKTEYKCILGMDKEVVLSSGASLIRFPIGISAENPYPVKLYLEKVMVNGTPNAKEELRHLSYTDNSIDIYYDAVSMRSMDNARIYYRVIGDESTAWALTSPKEGLIKFPALSPGRYKIELQAFNNSGLPTDQLLEVEFNIVPPFWQTWWFMLMLAVFVAAFILLMSSLRIKRIRYRNQLILDKVTLEKDLRQSILTSIRSQMNPHFVFNALNTIHSFIYSSDRKNASNYLIKFADLTRMILEMSTKESVSLREEIEALELYLYLEKVRLDNRMEYSLQISEELNVDFVRIPPMLIQPYVENAIKHGLLHSKREDRKLDISFEENKQSLLITIIDNGVGRQVSERLNKKRKKNHLSFASEANAKRLEIINQERNKREVGVIITDLFDDLGDAAGTKVLIHIPY